MQDTEEGDDWGHRVFPALFENELVSMAEALEIAREVSLAKPLVVNGLRRVARLQQEAKIFPAEISEVLIPRKVLFQSTQCTADKA